MITILWCQLTADKLYLYLILQDDLLIRRMNVYLLHALNIFTDNYNFKSYKLRKTEQILLPSRYAKFFKINKYMNIQKYAIVLILPKINFLKYKNTCIL